MSSNQDSERETKRVVKQDTSTQILKDSETIEMEPLSEQVFSIPLILKEVLKHLEMQDLLRTSLVSKNWSFFSREVLRNNRSCLAAFDQNCACKNLRRLNSLLLNAETIPFNGIYMAGPWWNENDQCAPNSELQELIQKCLGKINNIKYLSIDFQLDLEFIPCVRKFVREIILKNGNSLEEVNLDNETQFAEGLSKIMGTKNVQRWLPNVRTLRLPFELRTPGMPLSKVTVVKDILKASPKLEKFYGRIDVESLEFVVPLKKSKTVKEFFFSAKIDYLEDTLAFARENPKLERFFFVSFDEEDPDAEIFAVWFDEDCQNDVVTALTQLLESSKDSLRKVAFVHSDLILVTHQWDIPVLEKVNHMSLIYCEGVDTAEGYSTLNKIDWGKYFPNLNEISVLNPISDDLVEHNDFYIDDDFRESDAHFVCETVAKFSWVWSDSERPVNPIIPRFKGIFPNVKEFYLRRSEEFVPFLNDLWTAWPELEAMYMSFSTGPPDSNYDSVFLGISKVEADYFRENIEEFESLEIVATAPSIFNLPKLKKLVMHLLHYDGNCVSPAPTSETFFLSRLGGQCALARVPGLEVVICREICKETGCNCELNIKQLETVAKFVRCEIDAFGVSF